MKQHVFSHWLYLYGLLLSSIGGFSAFQIWGEVKPTADISWLDVLSEGGMTILAIVWLYMVLRSRPAGRVTQFIALGLCCIIFSWSMDVVDEFIRLPSTLIWHSWLESLPIPVALIFLSVGIYHWHEEEIAITAQMAKRERHFREHRLFDKLIPVGGAGYLRKQLSLALKEASASMTPVSVVAVDLNDFNLVNRRYGVKEGDDILQVVSQLLLINIRHDDLICRLAGDCFVILLNNTSEHAAKQIADDLKQAVSHLAYRTREENERVHLTATVAVTSAQKEDTDSLIQRLNKLLIRNKPDSSVLA